jgi:hypothetical protein
MAASKTSPLIQFRVEETEEGYLLHIANEAGQEVTAEATPEQMDAIIDSFADLLDDEDDVFEEGDEDAEEDEVA